MAKRAAGLHSFNKAKKAYSGLGATTEAFNPILEVSKKTLSSYIQKASNDQSLTKDGAEKRLSPNRVNGAKLAADLSKRETKAIQVVDHHLSDSIWGHARRLAALDRYERFVHG